MRKFYASHGCKTGPGGIRCPCCNDYAGPPRRWKAKTHRKVRRAQKQRILSGQE